MKTCPLRSSLWFLLLLAVACQPRRTTQPEVLAAATIGPAGGELTVASGVQAGLRITVPPGALTDEVQLRVVDVPTVYDARVLTVLAPPEPGRPFRVEPSNLYFDEPVTLRMPYQLTGLYGTAPGNVRVLQSRPGSALAFEPTAVDAVTGRAELDSRTLGQFQVVRGMPAFGIGSYMPPLDQPVTLADGWSFVAEAVPPTSPFAGVEAVQWHLTGPGFDEAWFFDAMQLRGRESPSWRETWNDAVVLWSPDTPVVAASTTTTTQVQAPIAGPATGAVIVASGYWNWDLPRPVGDGLAYDVARFQATLAWNRGDIGVGQREYVFWFAPQHGLLALGIDGVVHARTAP